MLHWERSQKSSLRRLFLEGFSALDIAEPLSFIQNLPKTALSQNGPLPLGPRKTVQGVFPFNCRSLKAR
jgi:hypothetical protein